MIVFFLIILAGILLIVAFSFKGNASVSPIVEGRMRYKYATLVDHWLGGHKDAKIIQENNNLIQVGVSNYGGSTIISIYEQSDTKCKIRYAISNNPMYRDFHLDFDFPTNMNQNEMFLKVTLEVQLKSPNYLRYS
ncbi:MAG: hypothetical protein IJ845_08425 [Bacteroidaceae bacterium]|nr:hypothetical protein [Bacteroidaceae bacterium]